MVVFIGSVFCGIFVVTVLSWCFGSRTILLGVVCFVVFLWWWFMVIVVFFVNAA